MDPVAHTLVGAALAETGLKRWSRYATATLIVGANLPDVDVVANFWGRDAALYFRRGWTHGVLALVVLPLLLVGAVWLWHQWRGRRSAGDTPPFRLGALVALSFLAVWTHPLLDWLNTYGIRLLMPFDGRWFYGDTLFIIDPWLWLLAAAGVVLARSQAYTAIAGWAVLAVVTSVVVLATDFVALGVKIGWLVGLTAIITLRWKTRSAEFGRTVARIGTAALVVYICAVYGIARVAESVVAERSATPLEVQANPVPGVPFSHRMVLVYEDLYRVVTPTGNTHEVPREEPGPIVQTAMASDSIRGFTTWMRYPYWEVQETPTAWVVRLWDLRYQGPDLPNRGIGFVRVEVPKESLDQGRIAR